jgi:hypothetical protein
MKVTVVPAQITTVEDRIAGSLVLSQMLLLISPIFINTVLYIALPPFGHSSAYKLTIMIVILALCCLLAIRIKSKLVLFWLFILLHYCLRPRYYVYNRNTLAGRQQEEPVAIEHDEIKLKLKKQLRRDLTPLTIADITRIHSLIENPASKLSFTTTKKGGLYVRITEIKEQS